jgi:hypothetical protein
LDRRRLADSADHREERRGIEDRTISPQLQRFMADRMKAKAIEVKASHLSLISHPREITNLILSAAGHSG